MLLSDLLDGYIQNVLNVKTIPNFCWSDSTVVLAWLDVDLSRWKCFVANRVSQKYKREPSEDRSCQRIATHQRTSVKKAY